MTLERPCLLLLLILPAALGYAEWRRRPQPVSLPFDHGGSGRASGLALLLLGARLVGFVPAVLAALAALILAGPQVIHPASQKRLAANVEICVDISRSMDWDFVPGLSRRAAAAEAIKDFTKYRSGDAFGLTAFAGEVIHPVSPTRDLPAIRESVDLLSSDALPGEFQGTRIGHALREIRETFKDRPTSEDNLIILISDGDSDDVKDGRAAPLAASLKEAGITVFVVYVAPGEIPEPMEALAAGTDGEVYAARDRRALGGVFRHIDRMRPAQFVAVPPHPESCVPSFAAAGFFLTISYAVTLHGLRYVPW
jgi:Ca-activated chloride channel family protein